MCERDPDATASTPPVSIAHAVASRSVIEAGTIVDGDYRIERLLGIGGMGAVYLARDLRLDRDVALKVHSAVGARAALRLAREATAMARVTHPNVVAVHRVGDLGPSTRGLAQGERVIVFVAMEHVAGGTLRSWLGTARTAAEVVAMFAAAGDGLAAAHQAGLVHRDFKPDNVLVGRDGRPRVTDFGLAVTPTSSVDGGAVEVDDELDVGVAATLDSSTSEPSGELPRLTATGACSTSRSPTATPIAAPRRCR